MKRGTSAFPSAAFSPYLWLYRSLGWGFSNVATWGYGSVVGPNWVNIPSGGTIATGAESDGYAWRINNPTGDASMVYLNELGAPESDVADTLDPLEFGYRFRVRLSAPQAGGAAQVGICSSNGGPLLRNAGVGGQRLLGLTAEPSVTGNNWIARVKALMANGFTSTVDTGIPITTEARCEVVVRNGPTKSGHIKVNGVTVLSLTAAQLPGFPINTLGTYGLYPVFGYATANATTLRIRRTEFWCRALS